MRRVRFLVASSAIPFLCLRRYRTVQAILRGFLRWLKRDSDFEELKKNVLPEAIGNEIKRITIHTGDTAPMTGVDLVTTKTAKF